MDAEELGREWSAWLEERKRPAPPDPEFTRRVMESVRAEARRTSGNPSAHRSANRFAEWFRTLLSPRPVLAFAALALAAALSIRYFPAGPGTESGGTRIKGQGFRVGYLLKRGASILPARSGERFGPGDRLQAVYSADRSGFIRFFSLDASGR